MLYLISDIHGDLKAFKKILKMTGFDRSKGHMIVMGDIFDWNDEGVPLLEFMAPYIEDGSMELIKGNHELFAQMYIMGTMSERQWIAFGGEATLRDIKRLKLDDQMKLQEYLVHLPHYVEIVSPVYGDSIVTHSGIHCGSYVRNDDRSINVARSIECAVRRDEYRYLISTDIHHIPAADKRALDRYIFCGHVSTYMLNETGVHDIYKTKYYTDLDVGAGDRRRGGRLACYCVDEDSCVYV